MVSYLKRSKARKKMESFSGAAGLHPAVHVSWKAHFLQCIWGVERAVSWRLPPNHVEKEKKNKKHKASWSTAPFQITFEGNFKAPVVTSVCTPPPCAGVSGSIPVKNDQTVLKVTSEKSFTVLPVGRGVWPQSKYCQSALPVGFRQLSSSTWLKVMMIPL